MTGAGEQTRDAGIDAVKGALILAVIVGHMPMLHWHEPGIVNSFYTFHVAGFLILTFFYPSPPLTRTTAVDRLVRYGVPFLIFYSLYAVAYNVVFKPHASIVAALLDFYAGMVLASTWVLHEACGLKNMWFLPALFTLTIARAALGCTQLRPVHYAALLIAHLLIGELGDWRYLVPWGVPVVLFIVPLGLAARPLLELIERHSLRLMLLASTIGLHALTALMPDFKVDLGDIWLYGLSHPLHLLLQDALMLSTTLTLIAYRRQLAAVPLLATCGQYSLPVYLTHAAIAQAILIRVTFLHDLPWPAQTAIVLLLTLAASLGAAMIGAKLPWLYYRVFPRSLADIAPTPRRA